MERQTDLANVIDITNRRPDYDATCRRVLAFRQILAHILRECVEEYRGCDLAEIESCIGPGVQIGTAAVARDLTGPSIEGSETADKSINEGTVVYDIRFTSRVPGGDEHIELIINIEAQRMLDRRYPLHSRAQYYGARLLSSQFGTVIDTADYAGLKRVYTIWICSNLPKEFEAQQNSINIYRMTETSHVGAPFGEDAWRDLIRVILVCLGNSDEATDLLRLLDVLLKSGRNADEKKSILSREFGIAITESFNTEVTSMCNLSEGLREEGFVEGIEIGVRRGREEGREEGRISTLVANVLKLMEKFHVTLDGAMDILEVSADLRPAVLKEIENS